MLGKLFNLGAVSGAGDSASAQTASYKSITSLDSVQEDIHTRNLLFPDPQDLFEQRLNDVFPLSSISSVTASPSTNAYDYNGSIELDVRDVRVIIMQDALGSLTSSLLYDSQSPPAVQVNPLMGGSSSLFSAQDNRRNPTSPRKPSLSHTQRPMVIQSSSPKTRQGAFENRNSLHGRTPGHGHFESDSQRHMREYREELATFSSCIFGNSELMAYKGTSTKVHVVPTEARQTDSGSAFADRRSSIGRASMRSSRLSQSFSSETMPSYAGAQSATTANRMPDRKRVLVTRLFPVSLPVEEDMISPRGASFTEDSTGYPFPQAAEDVRSKKKVQPKQKRTPMYAVPGVRPHRPSTAASLGTFSQSPPSLIVPILKEESLRRRINRRTGPGRASHSRNLSLQSQGARTAAVPINLAHLSMESRHERRASDASSIRTTHLPIRGIDPTMRKSSAATTGAITPEMSIPHFAMVHRADSFASTRPSSSNSFAADDLKRISRTGSGGSQSFMTGEQRQTSRWGSVISGLWSTRRRGSIVSAKPRSGSIGQGEATTPPMRKDTDRASMPPQTPGRSSVRQPGDAQTRAALDQRGNPKSPVEVPGENRSFSGQTTPGQKPQRIPDPSGAFESPVKTSITDDGVIDVDIPFPDYLASFETAVSSPSSSGYLSIAGFGTAFDTFEQSSRVSVDGDGPLNAAGWLKSYHPDFVLQAVPVQEGLKEQIKASMEAEPPTTWVPSSSESATEKWVDVSTAIIADSTTFTITRIRYRRLVKASLVSGPNTPSTMTPVAVSPAPTLPSPYPFEPHVKDEFIEETLLSSDDALVEAVEKVITTAADISKGSSKCSSRSTSKLRERSDSTSSQQHPEDTYHRPRELVVPQEVPRSQCKTVILSALEEIIREVIEDLDPSSGQSTAGDKEASSGIGRRRERESLEAQRIPGSILREAVRRWCESVDMGSE
ncbi:hypothetical protein N0V85_000129 [Neurospora sp. IMI 360204]|nr:hypothetical protein N0V85_000129 [Neurospora sp. IMI 360204]